MSFGSEKSFEIKEEERKLERKADVGRTMKLR
jgi:hypothetical protein